MISTVTAIAYTLKDAAAVISLLMIMRFIFLNKIRLGKVRPLFIAVPLLLNAFFGAFYLMDNTPDYKAVMDLISNVLYIAAMQLLTDNKKISKSIWLIFLYIFTVDMFFSLISQYIGEPLYRECIVDTVIFVFVCIFIRFTAQKSQVNFLPKVFAEIPKWIYVVLLLFELTCYYKEFGISSAWYSVLYIVSSAAVIVCVLYLVFKIFYMAYQQNNILQQMAIQKDFGEKAVVGDEELRRFRHDYKNHMIVVNAFLESGQVKEAREYLESVNDSINGVINKIKTGNFVSDAILNNKAVSAGKNSIKIVFSGLIPSVGIKNEDLCTILANLVDNAVEACEKLTAGIKTVEIEGNIVNGFFLLSVSNPVSDGDKISLKTTKKNKKNHGIGLKNIERTVKKYEGAVTVSCGDNVFTADIRMKLMKDKA
ncbi:MAG: sensor histidine kinase [Acutalibacteraceae bacterium]